MRASIEDAVAIANASRLAMSRLMAVAGHDLKQPLQVAMASLASAAGDSISADAAGRLRIALDAMKRLGNELDDIARLSQADDAFRPCRRLVRLAEVLTTVDRDWRFYAEYCGVDLQIHLPEMLVETDPRMLLTILRNLVGNAIKYSGPGGHVLVLCRTLDSAVSIDVHDDGRGIAAAQLGRIFDAFERGDQADQCHGLGLGLTIVRQTANLLQHPVSVRSVENKGTTFSVELPVPGRYWNMVEDI
ncbi:HAMP domain-containing sensor histidine kinase [Mesorhizobium sp. KR9-304]|uniref:sensor histidine kinase n=1 Tax=Mesorhizobium sp. KR9-304 TaxID=3156614 RepID=UPI0032B37EAA